MAATAGVSLMAFEREPLSLLICAVSLTFIALTGLIPQGEMSLHRFLKPATRIGLHRIADILAVFLAGSFLAVEWVRSDLSGLGAVRWFLTSGVLASCFVQGGWGGYLSGRILLRSALWVLIASLAVTDDLMAGNERASREADRGPDPFAQMVDWVRESTLSGPFLIPVLDPHRDRFATFQHRAKRPVWVDWKQGAAVMWDPWFYWQWMPRFREVEGLVTAEDFSDYALRNQIPSIILPSDIGSCPSEMDTDFSNSEYSVCTARF